MNKEKEIEEMANICYANKREWSGKSQGFCYAQAEALANAGYGNVKQVVKEFVEKFKKEFLKHFPTLFTDAIYQCTDSELDNLITELYVADE